MYKKILVVEDDNIIAFELQTRLEEKGYVIVGPYSYGKDAIQSLESNKVDLILMDINIKGDIDGIQTAELIKNSFKIPIIYLTAYADTKTLERAKVTEPFGYIIKPFDDRELFTNIELALYKHSMELKLIENEKWLHTTLKSIGDGVIATDKEANIIFMNEVAERLTGWKFIETKGFKLQDIFCVINEFDKKPAFNPVNRVLKEGIILNLANHTLLINKNGDEIAIADSAAPIKDEKGNVLGCVLVFQDHTEKKLYEKKINENEKKFRLIAENTSDGIITLDSERRITYVSPSYLKQLGYDDGFIIDENIESILKSCHPEDRDFIYEKFSNAILNFEKNFIYSYRIMKKNGEYIWREDNVTIEYDANNEFSYAYVSSRDISKQKMYEDDILQKNIELDKLNNTNNKLFSIIAHDLRNPIGNIKNLSQHILDYFHDFSKEELLDFILSIASSSKNTYSLLENLLEWSKIQQGKILPIYTQTNLFQISKNVIDILSPQADKKNILITNLIQYDIFINSDPTLISIILNNLITNAIKFTNNNGTIILNSIIEENYVNIFVKDSGIGINVDWMNDLFTIGKNIKRLGTNNEPSSGFGLMLCKEFIELLGGRIWVESEVNIGTTIYISLPFNINN